MELSGDILRALAFAAAKHRHQRRKDRALSPYINHLIDVANLLWHVGGVRKRCTLLAGILHDTLEDTDTTREEILAAFGPEVLAIVEAVTDDKDLSKDARKQMQVDTAPFKSPEAKQVKLADKCANVRDIGTAPPEDWSVARRLDYIDWAQRVVAGLRGANPQLEHYFDHLTEETRADILAQREAPAS
ncbi:MAG: HD domain-containing protein [Bacteroidia bacterium]